MLGADFWTITKWGVHYDFSRSAPQTFGRSSNAYALARMAASHSLAEPVVRARRVRRMFRSRCTLGGCASLMSKPWLQSRRMGQARACRSL